MDLIVGIIVAFVLSLPGSAVGAIIGALFIQFGTNKIVGFTPNYGRSWVISFCHQISTMTFGLIFGSYFWNENIDNTNITGKAISYLIFLIIVFFMQSSITYGLLKYENKRFLDSLKIMGIVYGLILLIAIVLVVPLSLIAYMLK
jgi:hypothetical protein